MIENITPYAAAKVTNIVLANANIEKKIAPQMLYTYAKKNIIENVLGDDGKIYFVGEAFKIWLDSYIKKIESGEVTSRQDYEALASQYI
jgi:hypothetical protein